MSLATATLSPTTTTQPPSAPPSKSTNLNSDESTKLAIGIALLRSKLSQRQPSQSQSQPQSSLSTSSTLHWKQKAKERKKEVIRLKHELKHLEDDLRGDLYPQSASCKCYFFNNFQGSSPKQRKHGADHKFSDVLRRRFLRQVRLQKRFKKSKSDSIVGRGFAEMYKEEESEQLKLSAEFLVDLCDTSNLVEMPHFGSLTHQAVDCILGFLNHGSSVGRNVAAVEGIISSLIVRLIKRMSTPTEDELYCDPDTDVQSHVQHIIRQLGSVAYVGQRVLLAVGHRISEQAEKLHSLDPFDESFALVHDSIFVMIQLIELLASDHLVNWTKDEVFDISHLTSVADLGGLTAAILRKTFGYLFEEWASSFLHARKALQSLEPRSGIYALYMDRVTGELVRQVGQISFLHKLNQDIIDSLFS